MTNVGNPSTSGVGVLFETRVTFRVLTGKGLPPRPRPLHLYLLRWASALALVPNVDEEVYRLGREVFKNDLGVALWLSEPASVLRGAISLEVLRTAKGRKAVVVGLKQPS